jgi:hypothetical protein
MSRSRTEVIYATERFMRSNDINAEMPDGDTPLHAGLRVGHRGIVEQALRSGAVIDEKAVQLALSYPSIIAESSLAFFEKYIEQEGFKPDAIMVEETGQTLLHVLLSSSGMTRFLADKLVSKGARVDIRDNEGKTAFDLALKHDNGGFGGVPEEVINKYLETHDVNAGINPEGDTLLHILANKYNVSGFYVESLMSDHGARFDIQNGEGKTALDKACEGCIGKITSAGEEIITRDLTNAREADPDGFLARMGEYRDSHPDLRIEDATQYIRYVIKDLQSARDTEYAAEAKVRAAAQAAEYEAYLAEQIAKYPEAHGLKAYLAEQRARAQADAAEEDGVDLAAAAEEAGVDLAGAADQ